LINILEVNPASNNATSFYRSRLPFIRLQKKYSDELMFWSYAGNRPTWDYILSFDMVFMHRPADKLHFALAQASARYNIPLIVDFDDLLTDIPPDNPAHDGYEHEEYQENIKEIIRLANVVIVSTNNLKESLNTSFRCGKKTVVIPNAFDLDTFSKTPEFKKSKNVLWRGGNTHQKDIYEFKDAIVNTFKKNKKWKLDLMGYNPFFISEHVNHSYTPRMDLDAYFELLPALNHSICIVPLHDCDFNDSKSNIAWVETTYAGAVCLAPDWEEWRRPGIINYKDEADFEVKLNAMINGEYDLKSYHNQSWHYISENLSLDKINEERYKILKSLTSQKQPQVQCTLSQ
jgi:glycosyltransferase involved in cell wall biosynthesis